MKITEISCEQFAGIRDKTVALTDGVNVIFGKNESGKSTLVNLLYSTLFQDTRKNDKVFGNRYFPKGGDSIDGKLTLTTEKGDYTLTKVWGAEKTCKLSAPEGMWRNQDEIQARLKDILLYGAGVYKDMLFSSQQNMAISLENLMSEKSETEAKMELAKIASQALSESNGMTVDAIEKAIAKQINDITSGSWDMEEERPKRSNSVGKIADAFRAKKKAIEDFDAVTRAEEHLNNTQKDCTKKEETKQEAQKAFDQFNEYAGKIEARKEKEKLKKNNDSELSDAQVASQDWPKIEGQIQQAKALKAEQDNRAKKDRFEKAKDIQENINAIESRVKGKACPEQKEITDVEKANTSIARLKNKLCGMNITAAIHMLGGQNVEITSLRTGEAITLTDDTANLSEAVKITVPGVMEMQLAPANVDVDEIEKQIAEKNQQVSDIFKKHGVFSIDALKELAEEVNTANNEIKQQGVLLKMQLGNDKYEDLEAEAEAIPADTRSEKEIRADMTALCGRESVDAVLGKLGQKQDDYVKKYGSLEMLADKIKTLEDECREIQDSLSQMDDIPAEYRAITDPIAHLEHLKRAKEQAEEILGLAREEKTRAEERCNAYEDKDYEEEMKNAEREFDELRKQLQHWKHIEEVFRKLKANIQSNPMQALADSFTKYLGIISNKRVTSESQDPNKLNMAIYSSGSLLDYSKLSEGTKETVSLAFRLAVLDQLFPDGGGVIVLDDPLTDMDAERVEQSCALIKECARKHQVIFLTCREEYLDKLNGNMIRM